MATRAVLQTFERYQKERVAFVSAVAEMAKSPQVRAAASSLGLLLPAGSFPACIKAPIGINTACHQVFL